ncbi:ABC transporter-like [Moorella glycerini]|uniref:Sn-glycerol-3-phosphate import ATP-binding protein UgpC n=1 Tax=Neomoorella stamsii TaxID=1266720 RepID=A0A9X7J4T5_9FIRM|nr:MULTISPECIES: ABC transporter ATP-binding protein [Moorella]PRR76454.1 sn-glycerol-3-phosphate import ATP-binding protein UgpC [Moorella stamsii]CEP66977.1 ABC transporter-like [Moorella glycerini]
MAEVRLEGVTKYYGRKKAVENVSFLCKEGEFVSILGPTGAGKTTILKLIAGIEEVTAGQVFFNGRDITHLPPQERNVSMAFETYNLYPHMSVYDNIAFPLRAPRWGLKLSPAEERQKVEEITGFLGIKELLERLPQQLSGGQKQRVSLARALVRRAEVYLLDEPIAHLDARLKFTTRSLLKEFAEKYGATIIYVTHDYREALALSDRVIVLGRGRIEQEGTPKEIYYSPASDFVGRLVGEPPMNLLDGEVEEKGGAYWVHLGGETKVRVPETLVPSLKKAVYTEKGREGVRLGIRSEFVQVERHPIAEYSFPLTVYAVVREAENVLLTFLVRDNTFLYARVERGRLPDCKVGEKLWVGFDPDNLFFFPRTVKLKS